MALHRAKCHLTRGQTMVRYWSTAARRGSSVGSSMRLKIAGSPVQVWPSAQTVTASDGCKHRSFVVLRYDCDRHFCVMLKYNTRICVLKLLNRCCDIFPQ